MAFVRTFLNGLTTLGIDLRKLGWSLRGLPVYWANRREYRRLAGKQHSFPWGRTYPCLTDRYESSGVASGHYFHQDLLVAQWVFRDQPHRHVDVGSRVDGFVAHVAAFREIEVFDIRELRSTSRNIVFRQMDLMNPDSKWHAYTDSLSCLHTLEHFGLGRYGDPVDPDGYLRGWRGLGTMLQPSGHLYFSTPMGPQRVEFDAHRVFGLEFLVDMMKQDYEILEFSFVNDAGELVNNADLTSSAAKDNFGCRLGCGIFHLQKRPNLTNGR